MKNLLLVFIFCCANLLAAQLPVNSQQSPVANYQIQPVPFTQVKLTDQFWLPRLKTVQDKTISYTFDQCEKTGRVKNFEIAGGSATGSFCGVYAFDDSDVYKIIEGAAYSLQTQSNPKLEAYVEDLIKKIAAAQEPDGYLYTWRTIYDKEKAAGATKEATTNNFHRGSDQRWEREDKGSHELYNAGHLYEAAVAWYQATGKRNLLDIALKSADLVAKNFGWGKIEKATGHQEIELGLAKLYLLTGEKKYLDLAKFFLDVRGYGLPEDTWTGEYMQNHQKVKDQRQIAGHAVRACYMYAGMADVTALTGDQTYLPALNAIWDDLVGTKMYVTGGIGSSGSNEGFTKAYDLPNYSAYCETCSSIAFVLWNQRMFQLTGESKYVDVLERTLYNALDAGLSLDGDRFFYPNPLESRKNVERSPWFSCACCPSNVARFFPSLPGYVFAKKGNDVYVNLFAAGETTVQNVNSKGQPVQVRISQETNYPWDGSVLLKINPEKPHTMALRIRIPGWVMGDAAPLDLYHFKDEIESNVSLRLNGENVQPLIKDGYAIIERKWKAGDQVELIMPMPVRQVAANQQVEEDHQKFALQRGPLVFCLEGKDQSDERVLNLLLTGEEEIATQFEPNLLGGVQTLSFSGNLVKGREDLLPVKLKAIPYFAWANRGKDNMVVWLPYSYESARFLAKPTLGSQAKLSASECAKGELSAAVDQYFPKNSDDHENPFIHWWPKFGTTEWLQIDFEKDEQVGTVRVYWFDDEASGGGCRVPKSWRVLSLEGEQWKPVYAPAGYRVTKDGWDEVQFEPVKTKALRVEVNLQEGVSAGVHEV
ncbi:MAG: beta-L-arabinofuranosidase domain-containing protein, partial [Bacteroidota bacterium]